MDDTEDDARYPPNSYENHQQLKLRLVDQYGSDDDDNEEPSVDEDDELAGNEGGDTSNLNNGKVLVGKDVEDDEDDDDDDDEFDDDHDDDDSNVKKYDAAADVDVDNAADFVRHPKKRKLKSLVSSYEFAPRLPPPPPVPTASVPALKPSFAGRNPLTDWTEQETHVLLDSWGDKFLQRGRKSLRSDEWLEVAEKVSEVSKVERTDTQCRNRLDTLKKKYKKEKGRSVGSSSSRWVYFKKMDRLMSTSAQQGGSGLLSCGLDSGEYVFMNPRVYLNRANGLDEMRDSPGNSDDDDDDEEDDSDGLPPKKRWSRRDQNEEGSEFRLLADSIEKFSEIYEKIETSKRQQMVELEKMRMDFHKDLEMQKREIMERAQSEIAKIREEGCVRTEEQPRISAEDASG